MAVPRIGLQWCDEPWVEVVLSAGGRSVAFRCDDEDEARVLADYIVGLVNGPNGDAEVEAMLAGAATLTVEDRTPIVPAETDPAST